MVDVNEAGANDGDDNDNDNGLDRIFVLCCCWNGDFSKFNDDPDGFIDSLDSW